MNLLKFVHAALLRALEIVRSMPYLIKRYRLKRIYEKRQAAFVHVPENGIEPVTPDIVELGQRLRTEVLERYKNKYEKRRYRFLFQMPPNGVGAIWFKDLMETLEHVGLPCASVGWNDPSFRRIWDSFQPNIFVSLDIVNVLRTNDLDFILEHKKRHGCLRLFTPVNKYRYPDPHLSEEDTWRLATARNGRSVDAYFCMFVEEYFDAFWPEWKDAGFHYLALPHGCNPLHHYPRPGMRDLDYFMATSCGTERIDLTWEYLRPVFEKYRGLWAGPGWGFGMGPLNSNQLPEMYVRAKIVPNPLAKFLIKYPCEITERAFSATASGVFQITDRTPVTDQFFSPHELIAVRGSEEFFDSFTYYLNHAGERNDIIRNGLRRVFAQHTYFHRIDRLIEFLDSNQHLFHGIR